ncbi:hypothetical protein CEUSTIGMA_g9340.t1 [Chlamydomonas eustigma]|uniref:Uncharacterized protein n=1 Tax=Chlamydomonas eustigma TaxID=1157962 RepID=A0A250XG62_9CHLO|nr:hypothetical protein CEUSTIGMA_g9340.t1 [Chlamydomonas eustigma]|eukprot:GAX81912.1 hypothetical protein CEUSTIGMA_g9340.t1 [Chlamydomonas eustigma]
MSKQGVLGLFGIFDRTTAAINSNAVQALLFLHSLQWKARLLLYSIWVALVMVRVRGVGKVVSSKLELRLRINQSKWPYIEVCIRLGYCCSELAHPKGRGMR